MVCRTIQLGSSVHIHEKHKVCLEVMASARVSYNGIPPLFINNSLSASHDYWVSEGPSLKFTLSIRIHDRLHGHETSTADILSGICDALVKAQVCCDFLIFTWAPIDS